MNNEENDYNQIASVGSFWSNLSKFKVFRQTFSLGFVCLGVSKYV